jgi:hypothetical protein
MHADCRTAARKETVPAARVWYLEDVMCVFVREAMAAQRRGAVDAEVVLVVLALPRVHAARVEELLR